MTFEQATEIVKTLQSIDTALAVLVIVQVVRTLLGK